MVGLIVCWCPPDILTLYFSFFHSVVGMTSCILVEKHSNVYLCQQSYHGIGFALSTAVVDSVALHS